MTGRVRPALGRATRHERAQSRAQIGKLRDKVVTPKVQHRYAKSIQWLFNTALPGLGLVLAADPVEFDEQLCRCVDMAWEEGEHRGLIGDLLSGLADRVPALRGRLAGAWRLYGAWGRLELPLRAWPVSPEQVMAMAFICFHWQLPDVGLALLLQFDGILRTGEVFCAEAHDFSFADRGAFLSLPQTKGSARKGAPEGVQVESQLLTGLLKWWFLQRREPRVLCRPASEYRIIFNALVRECHFEGHYRPYSLRRGGATHHFLHGASMDRTAERGRWSNLRTARIYINTSLSDRAQQQQSSSSEHRVRHFAHAMRELASSMLSASRQGVRGGRL